MKTTESRRLVVVVVILVVVALVFVIGLAVWIGATAGTPASSPAPAASPPSPAPSTASTPPSPRASGDDCSVAETPTTPAASGDDAPPVDLRLRSGAAASWPVSDTVGPTGERDDLPACFAPSPTGAALAAVTFLFEQTERSPLQTYATYVADTPGKEVAIRALNGHSDGEILNLMRTPGIETIGYRVDAWTAEDASVTIALRLPGSDAVSGWPVELLRVGGDWRVKLRSDGTVGDPSALEASDFREWAG